MSLDDYKVVFAAVFVVLVLLATLPTLSIVISLPAGERFSELWVLGPKHLAEGYPFNIADGKSYSVFLGVENHMSQLEYYDAYVKLRNDIEPLPNSTIGTPSSLSSLYYYPIFLSDGENWEKNVTFSFSGFTFGLNSCRVSYLTLNGYTFLVNKTATWDITNRGYYFELFFELWLFDSGAGGFAYHNRFVGLWLNMTNVAVF